MHRIHGVVAGPGLGMASALFASAGSGTPAVDLALAPTSMPRVGTVDQRFQSYNVEMLSVTGGAFWKPYKNSADAGANAKSTSALNVPTGMDPNIYQYRPPLDLNNQRLRRLAMALGPAYVRVSGTWANTTYFADSQTVPAKAPAGSSGVLSQQQWHGVIDFAKAVNAKIVTSFAIGPGTRDANGAWTADQARGWIGYTKSIGGEIAAAEFMNEPSLAAMGGAPKGYDAGDYGRDFKLFKAFADQAAPDMIILGPGSVGERPGSWSMTYGDLPVIRTQDMLAATGPGIDAFSYHHYGAASKRCAADGMPQTTADAALSEDWLGRTAQTLAFYSGLRDTYDPGKPMWLTEVADAACGGNPWAGTFLDSFRYLDQLGRLAKSGVQVVAHNTLAASDYGLLDEDSLAPKPNYWAALLWRKLMGTTVLDAGVPIQEGLHVYAHCQRGMPGGVALLVINNDRQKEQKLSLPQASERYTLDAVALDDRSVRLNGHTLALGANDEFPNMAGNAMPAGILSFAPATISFLTIPEAANNVCR
jgi:heparanase